MRTDSQNWCHLRQTMQGLHILPMGPKMRDRLATPTVKSKLKISFASLITLWPCKEHPSAFDQTRCDCEDAHQEGAILSKTRLSSPADVAGRQHFPSNAEHVDRLLMLLVCDINLEVVISWTIFLASVNTVFAYIGLDLNFLFSLMAVCTSGAVLPVGLLMCWARLNKAGAVTTQGALSITTLIDSEFILSGSLPASFDFELTRAIGRGVALPVPASASTQSTNSNQKIPQENHSQLVTAKDMINEPALCSIEGRGRTTQTENRCQRSGQARSIANTFVHHHWTLFAILVLIPAPLVGTAFTYPPGLFIFQCVAATTFVFISLILVLSGHSSRRERSLPLYRYLFALLAMNHWK
ncbi:hypothetical protein P154DRAFT_578637 [Amniculicola lignicola CBS 123094]|uniref:Uncharacterized protein n=1 Tax=Amniculicola lignicola CBS 123094 TaxID=1392246 RepID=A0A6A5W8K4_9PLEO|nr:hypothetical protein P154DRAFT_578637 [Amniculicola lignicola CBS 123094]